MSIQIIHSLASRALARQWDGTRLVPSAREAYEFALRASADSNLRDDLADREAYEGRLRLEACI